jgi:hypothetical protein
MNEEEQWSVTLREDGWYVIGNSEQIPVDSEEEGHALIQFITTDVAQDVKTKHNPRAIEHSDRGTDVPWDFSNEDK